MNIQNIRNFLDITMGFRIGNYLAPKCKLEEKVEDTIRDASTERVLKVHLVTLQNLIEILDTPAHDNPHQVVFDHRYHCVRNASLLRRKDSVQILVEFRA